MKGLGGNRSRHLSDNCEPTSDQMYPTTTPERNPYLLSPADTYQMEHHRFPTTSTLQGDCLLPLNNQIASSTFPRIHYNSHFDLQDDCSFTPNTSTSKINRIPANLLDQFEKQLPIHRDGFHTLQFQRGDNKHRAESPGRIRHLMHSVQKLFAKSQSLEATGKGSVNGSKYGSDDSKQSKRSKSKDRKLESKRRTRTNISGWWSSDDNLDNDNINYRNPMSLMTLGRRTDHGPAKYFMNAYNTISEHTLKASKSNNDLKCSPCVNIPINADSKYIKRGSWSTLTLSQSREVCQKSSATMDKALLKSKSYHHDLASQYLKVPLHDDWSSTLSRGKVGEIPCRRMRSGSYIKAMGDDDSEDSEMSPKPSPKTAARRQSYLKATQQSLSEQISQRNHSYLASVSESIHRSLDCLDTAELNSPSFHGWHEDYMGSSDTLKSNPINQEREMDFSNQYENICESVFSEMDSQAVDALDLPIPGCFRSRSHSYLRAIQAGCSQDDDNASVRSVSPPPIATTVRTMQTNTNKNPATNFVLKRNYSESAVSSCITTYKKTPPPVPPRTTSKPFISVTVQSSTESAQDTYLDNQDHKSDLNSQSGLSNSSDSLDSARALNTTKTGSVIAPVREQLDNQTQHRNATVAAEKGPLVIEEPKVEVIPKRKLSSIGIQVDCSQNLIKEQDSQIINKFQSIGIQVEDEWHISRSSSMTSKQETDSEAQECNSAAGSQDKSNLLSDSAQHHNASNPEPAVRQHAKSSQTKNKALAYGDNLDPALDPSSLPPPEPWLESTNNLPVEPVHTTSCRRDGYWFLKLLQAEKERMEGWCHQMEKETKENNLSEEVLGKIRSAVGSAQLLMSQKLQQFHGLCEQNLNQNANPRPTAQDLAGFWDMLQLSIEDISLKFDELYHLKTNDWQIIEMPEKKEEKKLPPPVPKKPAKAKTPINREKLTDSADKQRQEARKRLMAAKRAASVRQNSATESADSIEIYVPEAQTRL
ncbi:disks large-associated protein 4-like isoform X1 [Chiloscyllium plagiosum]|uniref:disks large-associated protein 4-like isoform X1 n=1 Tax=Chiloscyllium plagiosum TaxID=36176 RepID=UPI001CB7F1F4|nr:disks large-associated protein 4-like isoform X1 [Chiloscyllium plagiosum]